MSAKSRKLRLAVLVSGSGTNLQSLMDRSEAGSLEAEVVAVAGDRPGALGLERARKASLPAYGLDFGDFRQGWENLSPELRQAVRRVEPVQRVVRHPDPVEARNRLARRVAFEHELIRALEKHEPDFVCLAGFMRLLTPYFLQRFGGEALPGVLNIHPALLPAFPGERGYEDTFRYGCKWGGVTVHFVDEGEDTGPVIAQAVYPVWPDDEVEDLRRRGLRLEYEVYAQCVNWLARGEVEMVGESSGDRLRVRVSDPAYPSVAKEWTRLALED